MARNQIHPALQPAPIKRRWLAALFGAVIVAPLAAGGGLVMGRDIEYRRVNKMMENVCLGNEVKRRLDFFERAIRTVAVPLDRIHPTQFVPDYDRCTVKKPDAKRVRTFSVNSQLQMFR